MLNIT
jgi:hypothetical protein